MKEKTDKGLVFDIQRASLHDGPGIRTTVFLKGCPLNCLWCHNPEGISSSPLVFLKQDKCLLCRKCLEACEHGGHLFTDGHHEIDREKCIVCGGCIGECSQAALKVVGKEMSVGEVMTEVLADVDFYRNSGGGLTLSGGEPLLQFQFSMELLKRSRKEGIHTCLETSGVTSPGRFQEILPWVDYLLFDYKVTDPEIHKKYVGVDNRQILLNLDTACRFGIPVVLRCPIIPGINDDEQHFMGICELEKKYPALESIELMPYHNMGFYKAESIGLNDAPKWENVSQELKEEWLERIKAMGCKKVKNWIKGWETTLNRMLHSEK